MDNFKIKKEIEILEYAYLQLANGYGDKVSLKDLEPLKRVIIEKKNSVFD